LNEPDIFQTFGPCSVQYIVKRHTPYGECNGNAESLIAMASRQTRIHQIRFYRGSFGIYCGRIDSQCTSDSIIGC